MSRKQYNLMYALRQEEPKLVYTLFWCKPVISKIQYYKFIFLYLIH